MPLSPLRVLFVASECVPFIKTGGLGDVVGALPLALSALGHDVRVVIPRYRAVKHIAAEKLPAPFAVPMGPDGRYAAVYRSFVEDTVPVYLIEHDVFFDRDGLYGDDRGDFSDNLLRFAFLSRAALALGDYLDWPIDLLHLHDWQAALTSVFASTLTSAPPTVLSIHNLGYQGRFAAAAAVDLGIEPGAMGASGVLQGKFINVLRGGLVSADALTTVSPSYAKEVKTEAGGAGLHDALSTRSVTGILNGIDEARWDPKTDVNLVQNYDANDLRGKAACKLALQRESGLPERADVPLLGLVSRFAEQKGIDLFIETMDELADEDVQFVVLGSGESSAEEQLAQRAAERDAVACTVGFNEPLSHRIEAGCDLFIMPSRYEPCGLNQLYSQRYGTLPIVRAVGGLRDTVTDGVDGFRFDELSSEALTAAIRRAVTLFHTGPEAFHSMVQTAMSKPMGWDVAAREYETLYRQILRQKA